MNHRHESVSCDFCLQSSFKGKRYKCLLCYDFDLCSTCYEAAITKQQHFPDHPMQCILPRGDMELYFGGETLINYDQPQSFICPYCCQMGFTLLTLTDHVTKTHSTSPYEVICPICATTPGEDPNRMTDNLALHLTIDHRSNAQDVIPLLDENITMQVQDTRRISLPAFRGRTRPRRTNMQFIAGSLGTRARDPVDPIAELLTHLSVVRRSVSNTGNNNSTPFQQFQMQWQVDRHLHNTRQHVERLNRQSRYHHNNNLTDVNINVIPSLSTLHSSSTVTPPTSPTSSYFLPVALKEFSIQTPECVQTNCRQFVQDLMFSSLTKSHFLFKKDDTVILQSLKSNPEENCDIKQEKN